MIDIPDPQYENTGICRCCGAHITRDPDFQELHIQTKVIELELDTFQARHELIKEIRELSKQAKEDGDLRTAITGLDKAVAALDSLDKRLGRFAPQQISMKVEGEITHRIDIKAEVRKYITALELLPEEDIITIEAVRK